MVVLKQILSFINSNQNINDDILILLHGIGFKSKTGVDCDKMHALLEFQQRPSSLEIESNFSHLTYHVISKFID